MIARLVGPNAYELVNARQEGFVMMLDYLLDVAELRLGTDKTDEMVRIVPPHLRTITCPGDPSCPV